MLLPYRSERVRAPAANVRRALIQAGHVAGQAKLAELKRRIGAGVRAREA